MISKSRVSGIIHIVGGGLSIIAATVLVVISAIKASPLHVISFTIFGSALVLLYTMSSLYHMFPEGSTARFVFRHFDHMMIYVLIAGTYTPLCLIPLRGPWGWSIFAVVWIIAALGIIWKAVAFDKSRTISTVLYILMGWIIIVAIFPLLRTMPPAGLTWMALGGIMYTIGGLIYGIKKPNINCEWFGFHEIFHVFVILGSFCHFWMMVRYVMYIN